MMVSRSDPACTLEGNPDHFFGHQADRHDIHGALTVAAFAALSIVLP